MRAPPTRARAHTQREGGALRWAGGQWAALRLRFMLLLFWLGLQGCHLAPRRTVTLLLLLACGSFEQTKDPQGTLLI